MCLRQSQRMYSQLNNPYGQDDYWLQLYRSSTIYTLYCSIIIILLKSSFDDFCQTQIIGYLKSLSQSVYTLRNLTYSFILLYLNIRTCSKATGTNCIVITRGCSFNAFAFLNRVDRFSKSPFRYSIQDLLPLDGHSPYC